MQPRRLFLIAAALLALTVGALAALRAHSAPPWRARQVVLITIDTLRFNRLGLYGYRERPTSPILDAWSAGTVVFDRATAPAPWTVPSLGALHTGRYPAEVGAYTNFDAIHPDFTTLAELFHARGFATASFNTHALLVRARGGFRQGFDTVYPSHVQPIVEGEHKMPFADTEPHLMAWLEAHAHEPFFVWIHDMDPHLPPTSGNPYLDAPGWTRYDAEVRWTDEAVGRILAKLRALGLGDDLLVVFTADHGEAFGDEHGLIGHQDVMYDEVLRIPLLVRYPAMGAPRRIAEPVELIDLYPTIVELAGLPLPAGTRGESLVPLLSGGRAERTTPYAYHARYFFEDGHHWLAVRDREWKLLARTPDLASGGAERAAPRWSLDDPATYFELYRIADDPDEAHDLFEQHPEQVARLRQLLARWGESVAQGPTRPELDAATHEALRALGYEQ
jgi:arylsulfatase A-like enzyme